MHKCFFLPARRSLDLELAILTKAFTNTLFLFINVLSVLEFELGQCGDGPGARHGLGSVQSGHHIACSAPLLRDTRHTPPAAGTPDPGTGTPHSLAHRQKPGLFKITQLNM